MPNGPDELTIESSVADRVTRRRTRLTGKSDDSLAVAYDDATCGGATNGAAANVVEQIEQADQVGLTRSIGEHHRKEYLDSRRW
jgi:hypothetical protein